VATDPDAPPAGGGGSPFTKKIGGMPAWVVYVGGGLAIGIVYVIWKGRKSPDQTSKAPATPQGTAAQQNPSNPLILPIDQGLTDQQVGDLVAAITSLQGKAARPPHPPPQPQPQGKDWMQQEAELLASQTGESIAQIIWELQGKDPGSGPDPGGEGNPLPNDNLYGSWAGLDLGPWADQYLNGGSTPGPGRGGWGQDQDHGGRGGRHGDWGQGQDQGQGGGGRGGHRGRR
jgi:hypothetical protein